jgi:2-methylfumaryl-CoA hydratase
MKTNPGRFFEDYALGEVIAHAVPRTLSGGERALYHALYPARGALYSSDDFARACGLPCSPLDDLIAFHTVFGKTVPDISLNAVANLGYAEGRWLAPVYPGDTLRATSEVIGLKQNSSGQTGVVWVRTTGINHGDPVCALGHGAGAPCHRGGAGGAGSCGGGGGAGSDRAGGIGFYRP